MIKSDAATWRMHISTLMRRSVTLDAAITDIAGDIFRRSDRYLRRSLTVSFIVQEITMRRLRLLCDERRFHEVGHEVGSFVCSWEVVCSLTEALIGDKVIYESNTRQTRAFIFTHESGHTDPTRLVRENQLAAPYCEFVSHLRMWGMQSCTYSNYCR